MTLRIILAGLLALFASAMPAMAAGFADWAAIVVAGDYRAHSGADSEVFDNARRDLASDLMRLGFLPDNIVQFSVRPDRYPAQQPRRANGQTIATALWDLSNRTSGGCFAYFTSHGSPDGVEIGDSLLSPVQMDRMLGNACGDRPTVVVISACYSGIFVKPLSAPNRLVLTAARPDRTSFGCGEQFKYTFFDDCVLQALPSAGDFPDLAKNAAACVAAKEKKDNVTPASQPQLSIGANVVAQLPRWR
jgi:hypothetical protein